MERRNGGLAAVVCVMALALASSGCGGVGGTGSTIPFVADCGVTPEALQGTWQISARTATTTCGSAKLVTTGKVNAYPGVTVTKVPDGYEVAASGFFAKVDSDTCHISYTFLDRDTSATLACFCTFVPATRTVGAGVEDAHCYQASIDVNKDGKPEASCDFSPDLGSLITITQ